MTEFTRPKFIINHRNWWGTLTSTFVGSLLGIGVTFGISAYLENKHQNEVERKMLLATVYDIDMYCDYIDRQVESYASLDSAFCLMMVWGAFGLELGDKSDFPEASKKTYLKAVSWQQEDKSMGHKELMQKEKYTWLNSTNTDLIKIFGDLSTLNSYKNMLEDIERFEKRISIVEQYKKEILAYDSKYRLNENDDYPDSFIKYQLKYESRERIRSLVAFTSFYLDLQDCNRHLQKGWLIVKEKLGITEEDLRATDAKIFVEYSDSSISLGDKLNSIKKVELERLKRLTK